MKGKLMPFLLLALLAAGGTGGYLYSQGYWDTWADKEEQLTADFVANLGDVPEQVRQPFASCLAKGGIALATELECPVADEPELAVQIQNCANEKGAQQSLAFVVLGCIMEAQATLEGAEQQAAPQEQ